MTTTPRTLLAAAACAALTGCAGLLPARDEAPAVEAPAHWYAPLPQAEASSAPGARVAEPSALRQWWQQFDDPLLPALIDAAETVNPTLASARSRVEQARATRVAAGAALVPALDASANASRGQSDLSFPLNNSANAGLQASWELDLFGANRAGRDAAEARLAGARSDLQGTRIALAAEVATSYNSLRACEAQVEQNRADAASRAETARLTGLAARAGFQAPAAAALARASAAQGNTLLTQQRAACDLLVKSLVELTGTDEAALRARLVERTARLAQPSRLVVTSVPAEALAQRPDLFSAGQEVLAASAEVLQAEAQRYPRIGLAGSIGVARLETSAGHLDGTLWSIGPVTVSLPIFDAGRRAANTEAARARADEAGQVYRARLRGAVREVEAALVSLRSTADRSQDAQVATQGFAESLTATETLYKGGLASLFDLEDARRSNVQSQIALIDLQRERVAAWITLYRALGGGWSAESDAGFEPAAGGPAR